MTIRQKVLRYRMKRAVPLLVILVDIIPLYFFPKSVTMLVLAALTAALFFLNRSKLHIRELPVFLLWGAFASCVIAFRYVPEPGLLPESLSRVTALEGVLAADSRRTARGSCVYQLKLERVEMQNVEQTMGGTVTVFADGGKGFWGDSVRFEKVKLSSSGQSFSARKMVPLGSCNTFFFLRRRAVEAFTSKIMLIYGEKSFLAEALLTGSRDNMDPMLKEQFRRAGVSHVLALSGMHLGIISLFVFFVVRRLAGPRLSVLAVNAVNLLYLLVAGISPSLLRAVIMFALVSLGKFMGDKVSLMRVLVFAFSLILMMFPSFFFSVSFQLSFLALAGILLLTTPIAAFLEKALPELLATGIACSIAAMICTAPVTLCTFGTLYPVGIVTSVVISPVITIYMCLGLACVLIPAPVLICFPFMQPVFTIIYQVIIWIVQWADIVPGIIL